MQNKSLSQQKTSSKWYYGWMIAGLGAYGVFFSGPGQTYGISQFIDSYITTFGWSRSLVSGIYSAATLLAGFLLFLVGKGVDRFGHRIMSVGVGSLLGFACLWNSQVVGPTMLFIGFFALRLFGQGSMTLISNTLVPQWFISKRGRAISIMTVGGFLSSALFPPLNNWLIHRFGWSHAWMILGVLLLVCFVPVAGLLIRNRPEDLGLLPDNAPTPQSIKSSAVHRNESLSVVAEANWTLKEAMRTRAFWFILFCVSLPAMINTGITFHLVSIFGQHHLAPALAALVLSLMAILGFPVSFITGFLIEKIPVNRVMALSFFGQLLFLVLIIWATTPGLAILFGVVWGIVNGFERITLNIVWPNYFGRQHLGSIKGLAQTVMVIGSAFGPLPFGFAFDHFHSYTQIILLMMIFPILGGLAAFSSGKPSKQGKAM